MGEVGFLTPNNRRTGTVECIEDGQVLTITYERLLEIYFQNPQFGYRSLILTSQRLLENISRLEATLAQEKAARQTAAADGINPPNRGCPMTTSDQEAIEALLNGYYDAFGRDSAAVSASFFSEPALIVFPNQIVRLNSRADVESFYKEFVASLKPSGFSRSKLGEHHVKLLNSTTAICSAVTIRVKADGTEMQRSRFTYLLDKTDAGWKIHELIGTDLDKLISVN